ncbi:electron transfer flavoprotein subunit alpha/FixB family protein [Bacillus sp. DNRA2]|uniref:electron transfer flavoprotein subunit alpha/FixB family protein n=1 Tax=Bacillus sp. DNRA2 TaxID=2723053 RepID=UPI00145CC441|nr:electron transfer flavoprotein subunit alpha/FixB family protein [Bacillus sp. DNRA2]NMD71553.1 electron transfer flavoprotein subunit alpha/FixB family protein [Bacillus sp. DNRA2]
MIDLTKWHDILVFIETEETSIHPVSLQMIGKATELAESADFDVYAIVIGSGKDRILPQLEGMPLKKVYFYQDAALEHFRANCYAGALVDCIELLSPAVVLIGATPIGKAIAPIAATKFRTGLTADCTQLELRKSTDLIQIRPAFGGNVMAQIVTPYSRPQFATVGYNMMVSAVRQAGYMPEWEVRGLPHEAKVFAERIKIIQTERITVEKDITKENVLVVAGRGVKKKEDLALLDELAMILGGKLAATRGLVERGWLPQSKQIGLSGKMVRPEVLLAFGVSGSVQFMAGTHGAKHIMAVNNDPNAKIMAEAHLPILGDLYLVVPELLKKLKKTKIS